MRKYIDILVIDILIIDLKRSNKCHLNNTTLKFKWLIENRRNYNPYDCITKNDKKQWYSIKKYSLKLHKTN